MQLSNRLPQNQNLFRTLRGMLVLSLAACGLENMGETPKDETKYEYYSDDLDQIKIQELAQKLGVELHVEDADDFQNEYKVQHVLRVLERNTEILKSDLIEVLEIKIGKNFNTRMSIKKLILTLNYDAPEWTLLRYIQQQVDDGRYIVELSEMLSVSPLEVKVFSVFSRDQIKDLADRMSLMFSLVNYRLDPTLKSIEVADRFAIGQTSVMIDARASQEVLMEQMRRSIDSRLAFAREVREEMKRYDLNVTFQNGVFNAEGLQQATQAFKGVGALFAPYKGRIKNILIGDRWMSDRLRNSESFLMPWNTTADELKRRLEQIYPAEKPLYEELDSLLALGQHLLKQAGYSEFKIIADSVVVKADLTAFEHALRSLPTALDRSWVGALELGTVILGTSRESSYVPAANILFVRYNDRGVDGNLKLILRQALMKRLSDPLLQGISRHSRHTGLVFDVSSDLSQQISNSELQGLRLFSTWFSEKITQETAQQVGLVRLRLSFSQRKTALTNGVLDIDLRDFDPKTIDSIVFVPDAETPVVL